MEKSIFEQIGGTYYKQGDHFLPDLTAPEENNQPIGVWGQRHLRYIREHRRGFYIGLQLSGKLDNYLADIDQQAEDIFLRLVDQLARQEGITEELKAANQMAWVGRMNNILNRAVEVINADLILISH